MASLSIGNTLAARSVVTVRFLLTWNFPNRTAWSTEPLKNYYSTKYTDAWDVAVKTNPQLDLLEKKCVEFVEAFCSS